MSLTIPFALEGPLERQIAEDPAWQEGAAWGRPRRGHPEGQVLLHIADVLANVDAVAVDADDRARLRLIALVHDAFKHQVDTSRPRVGENHHGLIARRFLERYTDDSGLLDVVETHDDAYNAWRQEMRTPGKGEARAWALVARLGDALPLYLRFFDCDNKTGDKERVSYDWFVALTAR